MDHRVKSVHIPSFSGPYFPAFGLSTERYFVSLRIQSECDKYRPEKLRIRTLHAVDVKWLLGLKVTFSLEHENDFAYLKSAAYVMQ